LTATTFWAASALREQSLRFGECLVGKRLMFSRRNEFHRLWAEIQCTQELGAYVGTAKSDDVTDVHPKVGPTTSPGHYFAFHFLDDDDRPGGKAKQEVSGGAEPILIVMPKREAQPVGDLGKANAEHPEPEGVSAWRSPLRQPLEGRSHLCDNLFEWCHLTPRASAAAPG
jgi:hypothetical protein